MLIEIREAVGSIESLFKIWHESILPKDQKEGEKKP